MDPEARPLRILMVLESDYSPKGGGGAESQLRTLARHLTKIGHSVSVVTPLFPWGSQRIVERMHGIPVARLRYPRRRLLGAAVMHARFASFLVRRRDRYDVWHVHIGHHLGALTCLVGALVGKPVVVKISGWWELEKGLLAPDIGLLGKVGQAWLRRASVVQAISTRVARELEARGFPKDRIVILPNGIDLERFHVGGARRAPGEPFTVVYVGRLSEEKGVLTLLDAWAQAFAGRSPSEVRLQIVGGGPLEGALHERAERLGVASQVELLGHRDRVEQVLSGAHLGVLPSRMEGLSNALLEFMASGLPTAATEVSGSEDFVVPGQSGWLFPVSDAAALAKALREAEALSAEELARMGESARADVEERAAIDRVATRLVEIYRAGGA